MAQFCLDSDKIKIKTDINQNLTVVPNCMLPNLRKMYKGFVITEIPLKFVLV